MQTLLNKSEARPASSKAATAKPADIASASIPETLAMLQVNPDVGLMQAEVDVRQKEFGYNEVAEKKVSGTHGRTAQTFRRTVPKRDHRPAICGVKIGFPGKTGELHVRLEMKQSLRQIKNHNKGSYMPKS